MSIEKKDGIDKLDSINNSDNSLPIIYDNITDKVQISRCVRKNDFNMPIRHYHNEYEIYYLIEGESYYFIEGKTYHIKRGNLVFISPGQIHKTSSVSTRECFNERIVLNFSDQDIEAFFSSTMGESLKPFFERYNGVIYLDKKRQTLVEGLFEEIHSELESKNSCYYMSVLLKICSILLIVERYHIIDKNIENKSKAVTSGKHTKVEDAANYIHSNYTENISLDALSKALYVNKSYLSRIFREITGYTVNEYITIQRIKKAKELLKDSDYNITHIAELLGYDSITYFERMFKAYEKMSPTEYRKNIV